MFELIARRFLAIALTVLFAVNLAALSDHSKSTDPAPILESAALHLDSEDDGWAGGSDTQVLPVAEFLPVPVWVPLDIPPRPRAAVPVWRVNSHDPTGPPFRVIV